MREPRLRLPALVVHTLFRSDALTNSPSPTGTTAPGPGPPAVPRTRQYLQQVWLACRDLGMGEPIGAYPHLPGPDDLPDVFTYSPSARIVAARASGPQEWDDQAVLWSRGDVTGLSVVLPQRPGAPANWRAPALRWASGEPGGALPEGVLGTTVVARALSSLPTRSARRRSRVEQEIRRLSQLCGPFSGEPGPWSPAPGGRLLWEIPTALPDPRRRVLVVLAPADEAALDAWLWQTGGAEPAPLTRHLLNTGLVHHHLRVLEAAAEKTRQDDLKASADADALGLLHSRSVSDPTPLIGGAALEAEAHLERLKSTASELAAARADLRTLRRTAQALADNMRQAVPPDADEVSGSPLVEDRYAAERLAELADDAAEHTSTTIERAEAVIGLGGGFVAEHARAQRQHAAVTQNALLGGLLALLAAVQSLEYKVHLPALLEEPVILAVALTATMLPTGVLRLLRGGRQETAPVIFHLTGLALWGAELGWLAVTTGYYLSEGRGAPPVLSVSTAALCAACVWWSARRRFRS